MEIAGHKIKFRIQGSQGNRRATTRSGNKQRNRTGLADPSRGINAPIELMSNAVGQSSNPA